MREKTREGERGNERGRGVERGRGRKSKRQWEIGRWRKRWYSIV